MSTRWVLKRQAFDFTITHVKGSRMVVPDALCPYAVRKHLCPRCRHPLTDGEQDVENVEKANDVKESTILGSDAATEKILDEQNIQLGDLNAYPAEKDSTALDKDGVFCIVRNGNLAAVVTSSLSDEVLRNVHGSKLAGHYRKKRATAMMREKH